MLVVAHHNAFREALAMRLNQEEDLEVAFQSGSITGTREVHLNGIDQRYVDPLLPDGDGLELIREVSVANPDAPALVLSPQARLEHVPTGVGGRCARGTGREQRHRRGHQRGNGIGGR